MNTQVIDKMCNEYGINQTEFICILTFFQTENKNFSYAGTIAKQKKLKHLNQAALNFFNRSDVQKFILNERSRFWSCGSEEFDDETDGKNKPEKTTAPQKDLLVPLSLDFELTKENIKPVLERELSRTTDPEKRTALLIRVADFLSLNSSDEVDLDKPVIYLPDRIDITA